MTNLPVFRINRYAAVLSGGVGGSLFRVGLLIAVICLAGACAPARTAPVVSPEPLFCPVNADDPLIPVDYRAQSRLPTPPPPIELEPDPDPVEEAPDGPLIDPALANRLSIMAEALKFYAAYSHRLGIPLDGTEDQELILAVDEWLGTRYRWGGCSKAGVDCSCLVRTIYREVYGIYLRRTSYGMFYEDLTPVPNEALREGDILAFKIRRNRISHVGIYLKDGRFVHASRTDGVTISNLSDPYYQRRFHSGGRVIGGTRMSFLGRQSNGDQQD
jgi:hypothetical protein